MSLKSSLVHQLKARYESQLLGTDMQILDGVISDGPAESSKFQKIQLRDQYCDWKSWGQPSHKAWPSRRNEFDNRFYEADILTPAENSKFRKI